jgi:hypothetical protein
VALEFDSSRAPRRASEYLQLVRAVRSASAADETGWLEWKSTLDLRPKDRADKSGVGHIARAIVGFANRMPDEAARHVEGFGYLVVGVDPDGYHGVVEHDRVHLEEWITPYVGDIDWNPSYVHAGDEGQYPVPVLIVQVYPPQWGDPVRCMRKEAAGKERPIPEATVFIRRRKGSTDRARAADIDQLCGRLLRRPDPSGPEVDVTAEVGGITPVLLHQEGLERWLAAWRSDLLDRLHAWDTDLPLQTLLAGLTTTEPDPRTPEEYRQEVDTFLARMRDAVPSALHQAAAIHAGRLRLRLNNRTQTNLPGVELEVQLPPGIEAVLPRQALNEGEEKLPFGLPSPPRPYGPVKHDISLLAAMSFPLPDFRDALAEAPEIHPGPPIQIGFPSVNLRPGRSVELDEIVLISRGELTGTSILLSWQATSTHFDGAAEGEVTVPVEEPVSLLHMLLASLAQGEDEQDDP